MSIRLTRQETLNDYDGFVEKFKPKKTTDDCYTPDDVFEAVKGWACERFGIAPDTIVRPFWPGGDFEAFEYPDGCTVLDNPPFSIMSRICRTYLEHGIQFFLFCPQLTAFSAASICTKLNHIFADCEIEYENGAIVRTAFVTTYGDNVAETAPDLAKLVKRVQDERRKAKRKQITKLSYPDHVLTSAMMGKYAKYGIDLKVGRDECVRIGRLDAQKASGKSIYGGGLLLSDAKAAERAAAERAAAERAAAERAAAERAAAERAAAERFELSERERRLVDMLG